MSITKSGITRRDAMRGAAIGTACVAVAASGARALAAEKAPGKLSPGTYTATAQGYMGEVTVCVTVSKSAIEDVKVASCTDMPAPIPQAAIAVMPSRIVETQSVACDTVGGATMTSLGILAAVTDCLEQAGDADSFSQAPEAPAKQEGTDEEVDVLVIGAGGAGITAALSAKYADLDGEDSGISVMLVEKLGLTGGSIMMSGGSARTAVPLNDSSHVDDPTYMDPFEEYLQGRDTAQVNRPLLDAVWRVSGDTMMKIERLGGPWVTKDAYNDIESYSGSRKIDFRLTPPRAADHVRRTQVEKHWYHGGVQVADFFNKWLPESGVDVRLNTKFTELLVEDGVVMGAKLEGPDSTYVVRAKQTIMATGGFGRNPDMIATYAPKFEGVISFLNGGATGEGFQALVDLGATTTGDGIMAYLGCDMRYGMWPDMGTPYYQGGGNFVAVNKEGRRFVRDGKGHDIYVLTGAIEEQTDKVAWAIIDAENPDFEVTDASDRTDAKWKADTIEELAEKIGVDAEGLVATIDAYNAAYDAGEDAEFETKHDNMLPVRTAPFYAVVLKPIAIGSLVGLDCDENCQILVDGKPLENLHAAGELILGGNICTTYHGAMGNAFALYTGRISGEAAKAAVLGA